MKPTTSQKSSYFQKIGFSKKPEPSLKALIQIVEGHSFTFPFETVNAHDSGLDHRPSKRTSLNFNFLHRKLVHKERGGSCVELNFVLQTILKDIGFNVTPIMSDDLYMSSHLPKNERPKHCAAIVTIDEEHYLVDSAFGGIGLLSPLKLDYGKATKQYSELFRIVKTNEYSYVLQMFKKEQWTSLYGFENKAATLKSFQALMAKNANPLNKDSLFKNFFACTKPFTTDSSNGRLTIVNEKFTIIDPNNKMRKEVISSQEQLHEILQDKFNIHVKNRFLRFRKVDMLAYQEGITRPPILHRFPTRLKQRYEKIQSACYQENDKKNLHKPSSPRIGS